MDIPSFSSPVSSTNETPLRSNDLRGVSFAHELGEFRRYDKSTTLLAKKKRFSGGLNGAEFTRKNLTNSAFLPRAHQSFSLILGGKLLHISIYHLEQGRREVDPSLRQAPLEQVLLNGDRKIEMITT